MQRTAQTTTLLVEKPALFDRLEEDFTLIRYVLPPALHWRKNKNDYGQMHNSLRDQLDYPYRTFKYDRLDRGIPMWVVYVLYPRDETPKQLTIPFLGDSQLPFRPVSFAEVNFHLLLKLLQIAYFRGVKSERAGRFIGQDACYVYARYDTRKGVHICLQIELKGDIHTQGDDEVQEIKVIGHARPFRRVDNIDQPFYAYFGSRVKEKRRYFLHLKRAEVLKAYQSNEPIYTIRTQEKHRTTLAYHDLQRIEACVGKILYDFIHGFSSYLASYGISCSSKVRSFTEFTPPKGQMHLPLTRLNPIQVYDNRKERAQPLEAYIEHFKLLCSHLEFVAVTTLSQQQTGALLVLQDYRKEDFEEKGIFWGQIDPYISLYSQFPPLPKQSINVNTNESEGKTAQQYLDYPFPSRDDEQFQQKVEVALSQLYLKDVIFHERSVEQYLPFVGKEYVFIRKGRNDSHPYETLLYVADDTLHFVGKEYVFIRKGRNDSHPYETLLYVADDTLHFLDLRDPSAVECRDQLLKRLGVDWDAMYDQMLRKYRKTGDEEEARDLPSYNVIVGPQLFIELEGLDERVLYNYDEIVRRQEAVKTPLPIDTLKLVSQMNRVRSSTNLSYEELQRRGLISEVSRPKNDQEKDSLEFYRQLERYDAFLDEVADTHVVISYNDLTQGELWEEIIRIFAYEPDKNGHYSRRQFKALYQKMGWFSSDKAKELQLYEGIWYDDDHCYMVGSAQAMKLQQPRAHLIRHFDVYMGADHFKIEPLLLATSVQFVRLNQYTVYPYAFHLIDIYVENVLRFQ